MSILHRLVLLDKKKISDELNPAWVAFVEKKDSEHLDKLLKRIKEMGTSQLSADLKSLDEASHEEKELIIGMYSFDIVTTFSAPDKFNENVFELDNPKTSKYLSSLSEEFEDLIYGIGYQSEESSIALPFAEHSSVVETRNVSLMLTRLRNEENWPSEIRSEIDLLVTILEEARDQEGLLLLRTFD